MCQKTQCHGASDCVGTCSPRNVIKPGTAQISACSSVGEERRSSIWISLNMFKKLNTGSQSHVRLLEVKSWNQQVFLSSCFWLDWLDLHVKQLSCLLTVAHNVCICTRLAWMHGQQRTRTLSSRKKLKQSKVPYTPSKLTQTESGALKSGKP